jgi:hypothetical protein
MYLAIFEVMLGCAGFGWADCAKGRSSPRGRDAVIPVQSGSAVFFPHCSIPVPCTRDIANRIVSG